MKVKYFGLSAFLITSDNGTRIITDPYSPDMKVLFGEIKESADVITISCGHFNHCHVFSIGGEPYIYTGFEPAELKGIKFRGIAAKHLAMKEDKSIDPGPNNIICFEIDGIKICHLGALGHKLSAKQVAQIGKVDMLFIPAGGYSAMPVATASEVVKQINPAIVFPMHYRTERCTFPEMAYVDEFLQGKKNFLRVQNNIGSSEMEFNSDTLPSTTKIIVLKAVF